MRTRVNAIKKKPGYPEDTEGSRLAAKADKLASKLTPKQISTLEWL